MYANLAQELWARTLREVGLCTRTLHKGEPFMRSLHKSLRCRPCTRISCFPQGPYTRMSHFAQGYCVRMSLAQGPCTRAPGALHKGLALTLYKNLCLGPYTRMDCFAQGSRAKISLAQGPYTKTSCKEPTGIPSVRMTVAQGSCTRIVRMPRVKTSSEDPIKASSLARGPCTRSVPVALPCTTACMEPFHEILAQGGALHDHLPQEPCTRALHQSLTLSRFLHVGLHDNNLCTRTSHEDTPCLP